MISTDFIVDGTVIVPKEKINTAINGVIAAIKREEIPVAVLNEILCEAEKEIMTRTIV